MIDLQTNGRIARRALLLALVAALLGAGCGGSGSSATHTADGVVRGVDTVNQQVVLEHGDIPGFMKAMTMGYEVADPSLLEGLSPGERVEFDLEYEGEHYRVTAIRPQ